MPPINGRLPTMTAFPLRALGVFQLLLWSLLLPAPTSCITATTGFKAGISRIDITPDYPIRLNGFGGRRTESEGISQRIWAKALALEDPANGPAILIAIDNLGVPDYIHTELSKRLGTAIGLKPERLCLTATHTHTAPLLTNFTPTIFSVAIPPEHLLPIERYTTELILAMEKVALEAWKARRDAVLSTRVGQVTFAMNRRTKGGPVDHDLPVLAVRDLSGTLLALYTSYACHCVTLSDNKISGDWAGYAQAAIERAFPGVLGLTSVGCGADSNPSSGVTGDRLDIAAAQGQQIADEIVRLLAKPMRPVTGPLSAALTRVILPFDPLPTRSQWVEKAKRKDAVGYHAEFNLAKLDRGETLPTSLSYPIQTWTFGDSLALVNLPGEVVVDYSLRLKQEFDRSRLWVNAYANDAPCYIPSERILREGGYEGGDAMVYYDRPARFAPGLEKTILDAVHQQMPAAYRAIKGTDGIQPLRAAESLKTLQTHPGLEVELVASEPEIVSPVAIDWSADGSVWVCEMYDYPQGMDNRFQPGGRIRHLKNNSGGASYTRSQVFLNSIPFPTGLLCWGKGVLVCAAPDILYAEDTDQDGKADRVVKVFTGFSTENYQARVNSLGLGLDGWIYGANGLLGGVITNHLSGGILDIRGRDFRFRLALDLSAARLEPASGLTQQGRVRTDWDDWFGCDNSTLLHHFPLHDRYVRRNPHVPGPPPALYPPDAADSSHLYPISRALERFNDLDHLNRVTSACGIGIYRDNLLGTGFKGDILTCEPVHNLVHRLHLLPQGPTFLARRPAEEATKEFLSSDDNWFRPVQIRTGPDGALWVVDMYRFLMEHPRWITPQRLASLDMRAGADMGRLYRIKPAKIPLRPVVDLTQLNADALVDALNTPNGTERDRVQFELFHRNDPSVAGPLAKLLRSSHTPEVRAQALSAIAFCGLLQPTELIFGLNDRDARVQALALVLSEPILSGKDLIAKDARDLSSLWASIQTLISSEDARLRYQLALSLGESTDPRAGVLLASLAQSAADAPWLQAAILTSARPHAGTILTSILPSGDSRLTPSARLSPFIQKLFTTLGSATNPIVFRTALDALLPSSTPLNGWRLEALSRLLQSSAISSSAFDDLLMSTNRGDPWVGSLRGKLRQLAGAFKETGVSESERLATIGLLGRVKESRSADASVLVGAATAPDSPAMRAAALTRLGQWVDLDVPLLLLADWPRHSPRVREDLIRILLSRDGWIQPLLEAVKTGQLQLFEIPQHDRKRFMESPRAEIRESALRLFPVSELGNKEALLSRYAALPVAPARAISHGAELFGKHCSSCHLVRGIGQRVGPELDALSGRDADFWIKNILDPNSAVEPRFVAYQIERTDERILAGVVETETATSLTVVQPGGVVENLLRSEVKSIKGLGISLMPEGLEQALPPEDMAALLSFLRAAPPAKSVVGQRIETVRAAPDHSLTLSARTAELRGGDITLESEFQNIGLWHGVSDQASWTLEIPRSGDYDLHLDYACAEAASGNQFTIVVSGVQHVGTVAATGPNWDRYQRYKIATLALKAGEQPLLLRPEGKLRGALMDLKTVLLVPTGQIPPWPQSRQAPTPGAPPRDPAALARVILDPSSSDAEKEGATSTHPHLASDILRELINGIGPGTPEEYRRIPWVWRLALLTARRNDAPQMQAMLEISLPLIGEPLCDWQAVVLGGGLINGLSQLNLWPAEILDAVLAGQGSLQARWDRSLQLAASMADNLAVPTGTRYDALRMLGVLPWERSGAQLSRYLETGNAELQGGAVSGLGDIPGSVAAEALLRSLPGLAKSNSELALDVLLRGDQRVQILLKAIQSGVIRKEQLGQARSERLQELPNPALRRQANQLLTPP